MREWHSGEKIAEQVFKVLVEYGLNNSWLAIKLNGFDNNSSWSGFCILISKI